MPNSAPDVASGLITFSQRTLGAFLVRTNDKAKMFKPLALSERNRLEWGNPRGCGVLVVSTVMHDFVSPQRLLKCKRERFEHFRLLNFEPLGRRVLSSRKCDQTVRRGGGSCNADSRFDLPKVSFANRFPCPRTRLPRIQWSNIPTNPSDMGSKTLDSAKHSSQRTPTPELCVYEDRGRGRLQVIGPSARTGRRFPSLRGGASFRCGAAWERSP